MTNPYVKYYVDQAGHGMNVFHGASYQRGHGIGQIFAGLARFMMPLFKSGARALGRQALATGSSLLGDVIENKPFKEAVRTRFDEAGANLKRKAEEKIKRLAGSGLKGVKRRRGVHSTSGSRPKKTKSARKVKDIFS